MWTCIDYQLDFLGFVAGCLLGLLCLRKLVKRCQREHAAYRICGGLTVILLVVGYRFVHKVDDEQRCNLINHMSAFATTYAGEMERLGHADLPASVSEDDPLYLRLIDAQSRWLQANSLVSDIYTIRRNPDGSSVILVDSETDYNHNGRIDQDRERRTRPCEPYSGFNTGDTKSAFEQALSGTPAFVAVPYSDRWGDWVSALHPLKNSRGEVDGILGVDFPAALWGQQIFNARLSVIGIMAVIESLLLAGGTVLTMTRFHLREQLVAANRLQQFKTTLDQTLDSVFMFHPETRKFIYVNEGAKQLLGYSETEYLEMTPFDIVPNLEAEVLDSLIGPLRSGTHQLITLETIHKHRDGHEIPVELSLQFVRQSTDTPRFVGIVRDITERKKIEKELIIAARLDRLTGLPNRALFNDRLRLFIDKSMCDPNYRFALMFLDFDRFKVVNDSLGHDVGDSLLREIASRLKHSLRTTDSIATLADGTTVSRLGGDEFVVILDNISGVETACQTAQRLIDALGEEYQLGEHQLRSTASIGIVCSDLQYERAEDMVRDADTAMYEAKARGKACYVVFDESMREAAERRLSIENDLRRAIGTDQISLLWQPIISLESGRLQGVEALMRWNHPERGEISSQQFLPIAAESRLLLPLYDWMLEAACCQFGKWIGLPADLEPKFLSLNLTHLQLMQTDLAERILSISRRYGVRPDQLQLELSESELLNYRGVAGPALHALSRAGFRLAIDDFGAGYSSLACLQEFPFDVLKIDQKFIRNLNESPDTIAVTHSIVSLADNLGIRCIAVGIQDPVQLVILQSMNCTFGQGEYIAPAGHASEILRGVWKVSGAGSVRRNHWEHCLVEN
ncbi:MAG: EAL domain-containing protein [Planctomyces sp.]|nr:EAL domain-containing protein [Planctomyces sp.]